MNDERERQYVRAIRLLKNELDDALGEWRYYDAWENGADFKSTPGEDLANKLLDAYYGTEGEDEYWPDLEE